MSHVMSHVTNHRAEVDVRRQQVLRASWADTASSGSIVNSSSSAASDVHIQRYDAPSRLSHNITRPLYPPSCLPESPNFHDTAARWKPTPADRGAPYPPPSYRLPAAPLNGSIPYPGVVGRGSTVVGRGSTLCHVDPVVRGACVACEYIRHNARSSRYEPYSSASRRSYAKSTHHSAAELRHTAYY